MVVTSLLHHRIIVASSSHGRHINVASSHRRHMVSHHCHIVESLLRRHPMVVTSTLHRRIVVTVIFASSHHCRVVGSPSLFIFLYALKVLVSTLENLKEKLGKSLDKKEEFSVHKFYGRNAVQAIQALV
jgi:hypothetical protein